MSEIIGVVIFPLFLLITCFYILGQLVTNGCLHAVIREYFYGRLKGSPCLGVEKVLDDEEEWIEGHWSLPDGGHYVDPDVLLKHHFVEEMKKKKETIH